MNIYEIDNAMFFLVDEETGEIKDYEAFEEMQMIPEEKIENTALWYKNLIKQGYQRRRKSTCGTS